MKFKIGDKVKLKNMMLLFSPSNGIVEKVADKQDDDRIWWRTSDNVLQWDHEHDLIKDD